MYYLGVLVNVLIHEAYEKESQGKGSGVGNSHLESR